MSIVIAEGVVEVTADAKDAGKKIADDIEGGGSAVESSGGILGGRFTTGITRGLATVGKITAVAVGAAALAVGVGVGAIVANGVKFDASMQNYTAAFTPLLGGADAAKEKLGELSAFAAATPFTIDGLAGASQTLLAFGTTNADLLPDLKMLGDISQGNQEKLSGLALVFGQVQSNGHLMGQDLLQMINQGFNPLEIISQKTGESMESLRGRMAAGQISFQEVKDAMVSATSAGGMFYGSMDLGAKTLTGAWSSTGDGARILSGAVVSDLTPALTGLLNDGVNPLLGGLVDLVNGTAGAQAEVDAAVTGLETGLSTLGPAIGNIATNLGVMLTAVGPALGEALGYLVSGLVTILPSIVSVAGNIITTIVSTIAGQAPALATALVPAALGLVEGLLNVIPELVGAAGMVVVALAQGLTAGAPQLITSLTNAITDTIGSIVGVLPQVIDAGLQLVVALVTGLVGALPTLIPTVVAGLLGLIPAILGMLPTLLNAGLQLLLALVQGILGAIPQLIAALPAIIISLVTFVIGAIPQLIQAGISLLTSLVTALPQIIEAIVKALPQIIVGIITALISAIPQLIVAGVKLLVSLITDLPAIISAIITAVPQIIQGLVKAFGDPKVIGQLAKAGGDLIRGLWQGIQDLGGWIWGKISGFASGIVNQIKGFFGIHSPSTLMRDEVGNMLGQGLAIGITDSTGVVADAAAALGASARVNVSTSAGVGTPGAPSVPFAGNVGGTTVIHIDEVHLDASNIDDLTDLVAMFKALPQAARQGRGVTPGTAG